MADKRIDMKRTSTPNEQAWQVAKDVFTKTRDERYAEATKGQRFVYWLFIAIVFSTLVYGLVRTLVLA